RILTLLCSETLSFAWRCFSGGVQWPTGRLNRNRVASAIAADAPISPQHGGFSRRPDAPAPASCGSAATSPETHDGTSDHADGNAFLDRSERDPHQFRFIVSPEDSSRLQDLKPFIRDLMQQMEQDLDTKLDWVAIDHFNTGHPHT